MSEDIYELPVQLDSTMHMKIKLLDIFQLCVEETTVETQQIELLFTHLNGDNVANVCDVIARPYPKCTREEHKIFMRLSFY